MNKEITETSIERSKEKKNKLSRMQRLGRLVIALTALSGAIGFGMGEAVANNQNSVAESQQNGLKPSGLDTYVKPGEGLYGVAEDVQDMPGGVGQSESTEYIETQLIQANPNLAKPDHILQPGETVSIPIDVAPKKIHN